MKKFGVRIFDKTANHGNESMCVSTYENLDSLNLCFCNDAYDLSLSEAEALKSEYEKQIVEKHLEWASVDIDFLVFD